MQHTTKPQEPDSSFSFWSQPVSSNKPKVEPEPKPNPKVIDFVQAYFTKKYSY